jgi:uncharacterized protein YuzB (UPF0349 family)
MSTDSLEDLLTVINGFTFCGEHIYEFCHRCILDFRLANSKTVADALYKKLGRDFKLDVRVLVFYACFHICKLICAWLFRLESL